MLLSKLYGWLGGERRRAGSRRRRRRRRSVLCAPSSSQTCKVLDCAVAPVVHIIMENGSKAPKAIRMAPEGAPNPQGLALYVITEEIIVSLPALTHRQRGMIKRRERCRGGGEEGEAQPRSGLEEPERASDLDPEPVLQEQEGGERGRKSNNPTHPTNLTHSHTYSRCNVIRATQRISLVSSALSLSSRKLKRSCIREWKRSPFWWKKDAK